MDNTAISAIRDSGQIEKLCSLERLE